MNQEQSRFPLIVGAGRVATHLKGYLGMKGVPFLTWNRREHAMDDLAALLDKAGSVLLLIKDNAIAPFRDRHLASFDGLVAHFSGALNVTGIESFHPLMTFGPSPYPLSFYEKIFFAVSSEEKFRACFPDLPNPAFALRDQDKAFYHALCVMSGNFPQILWQACLPSFNALGVPQEAVALYLQKNLENFLADPARSLTGPLARGDAETIEKNLAALPSELGALYRAFADFYAARAKP